ncbi:MAG: S9 family peptidase [Blastocatellia bacterium]
MGFSAGSGRHSYIYLFDIETKKLDRLTAGKWDEAAPSWSPDGARIAFMSNHAADPDREPSSQIFIADAKPGATEKALTPATSRGGRSRLEWSPDGKWIAFLESDEKKWGAYNMDHLTYPAGYVKGTKVPMLLRIHGGPNGQDQHSFSTERQLFAAQGYAVLAVNYRGSAGRGQKFSRAIFADWGHYEVEDLQAGVDHVVKMGVADPDRLGVGGWSYGGILTDYLIASDNRFKAATSGAGTAFTVSYYGTDHYITQYDNEIGPPWDPKAWATYQKLSYPFLHADRIKTPTLFLCGEKDFNVPVSGSEQMYQALRSLGVETQLVIYPGQFHGITRPSYNRDRMERYLAWYEKYLKKAPAPAAGASTQDKR